MKCPVVLCDYWWFSFGTIGAHNHGSSVGHCEARISPGSGIVKGTIVEVGLVHLVLHDNFRVVGGGPFLSLAVLSMFFAERGHPHE